MDISWRGVAAAVTAAVCAHLAAAFVLRGVPLVGAGGLAIDCAEILDRPELARPPPERPLDVALGSEARPCARSPGPRPVLDPAALRRPPAVPHDWTGGDEVFSAGRRLFAPGFRARPLRSRLTPGVERRLSRRAIDVEPAVVLRSLPSVFGPRPSLASAAESARPRLDPGGPALELPRDLESVPVPSFGRGGPDEEGPARGKPPGALPPREGLPELFIDVLRIGVAKGEGN
jgi:hypothetical protein